MRVEVVGIRPIRYVNKSGRDVSGTRLYVVFDERNTTGKACMDVYLSQTTDLPLVGDIINLIYNRYGRCVGFDLAG